MSKILRNSKREEGHHGADADQPRKDLLTLRVHHELWREGVVGWRCKKIMDGVKRGMAVRGGGGRIEKKQPVITPNGQQMFWYFNINWPLFLLAVSQQSANILLPFCYKIAFLKEFNINLRSELNSSSISQLNWTMATGGNSPYQASHLPPPPALVLPPLVSSGEPLASQDIAAKLILSLWSLSSL